MKPVKLRVNKVIHAPAEDVYHVIIDYHEGHQMILPRPPFTEMQVLKGGYGEGTELLTRLTPFGQEYTYHQRVSEPEPGRVIRETDIHTGQWSQFTVDPIDHHSCRVTIETEMPVKAGVMGFFEWMGFPLTVPLLFRRQLNNLAAYMKKQQLAVTAHTI